MQVCSDISFYLVLHSCRTLQINWGRSGKVLCFSLMEEINLRNFTKPYTANSISCGYKLTNVRLRSDQYFPLTSVQCFERQHMATDRTWHPGPCRISLESASAVTALVLVEVEKERHQGLACDGCWTFKLHPSLHLSVWLVMSLSLSTRERQSD